MEKQRIQLKKIPTASGAEADFDAADIAAAQSALEPSARYARLKKKRAGKLGLIAVDVFALVFSGLLATTAWSIYSGLSAESLWYPGSAESRLGIFSTLVAIAVGWFLYLGHYTRRRPFWDELREILRVVVLLAIADASLQYLGKLSFSRFWFLGVWAFALVLLPILRFSWKRAQIAFGRWSVPTVVVGTGENAKAAAEALSSEPMMGFEVVAFASTSDLELHGRYLELNGDKVPVIPLSSELLTQLSADSSAHVVVALESAELQSNQVLISKLHRMFGDISIVPDLKGLPLYGMEVGHFFRHEALFLRVRNNLGRTAPRLLKRTFDVVLSVALLALLSPLFAYIALRIRQTGATPFFSHRRVGQGGRHFQCFKFRTMVPNAQEVLEKLLRDDPAARAEWEQDFKLKNDPRITSIGQFLRKTSLDELPQLWNVLKGDMSLVGPRPIVDAELPRYGDNVAYYLETKPGMTGLWQISGRNDTDYENRVYLDTWYSKNWSVWTDVAILAKTVTVVMQKSGAY